VNILAPLSGWDVASVAAIGSNVSQRELIAMIEDALSLRSQAISAAEDLLMHCKDAEEAPRYGDDPAEHQRWAFEAATDYYNLVEAYNALVHEIEVASRVQEPPADVFSGTRGEA